VSRAEKNMSRKITVLTLCAMLFAFCSSADAQQRKKVFRLGYLSNLSRSSDIIRAEPFLLALREHGYIEGKNIAIEYRHAEGKRDRLPELAAEWCVSRLISSWQQEGTP
jgi:hypothetical protein